MDITAGDILHSEEQLRNTLHCDDKEKLRKKLAQLQREYLKTAQRLQRAERLDAVRRHVRSRISQQKQEVTPDSSSLITNPNNSTITDQRHTEGPDISRRNQVIRFALPSDAACPQTPDSSNDASKGYKPSPALRLRSRRSRLRLERRSAAEAGRSTDNSQQEQDERMDSARTENEEEMESKEVEAGNKSEEQFSGTESESPSLLLTHWNTQGHSETGSLLGKEDQKDQDLIENCTELKAEGKGCESASMTEMREQSMRQTEETKNENEDGRARWKEVGEQRKCNVDRTESSKKNSAKIVKSEKSPVKFMEIKDDKITREGKAARLLDSCTLVEGLLFPAEYYVRTTRRMTSSQSQPDVRAVILSQLSMGRRRRGRGRGRGPNRDTHTLQAADASAECCQYPGDISDPTTAPQMDSEACFSPSVTSIHPQRGKRRRRGRGRGRPRSPQSGQSREQTSRDPQPPSTSVSSFQSVHEAETANSCFSPVDSDPVTSGNQLSSTLTSSSQSLSEVNGAPASFADEHLQGVYPIFLKSTIQTSRLSQMNKGSSNQQALLLLSSSSPTQTSPLPLRSLFPVSLISSLKGLDVHQDFHLPDDQFASLKLHKLRQVAVESGVQRFSTPSHNTRSSIRRSHSQCSVSDTSALLPPLSFAPTDSPLPGDERQLLAEDLLTGESSRKESAVELHVKDTTETSVEQQLHAESLNTSSHDVSVVQEFTDDCGHSDHDSVTPHGQIQSCTSFSSTHRPINCEKPQPHQSFGGKVNHSVTEQPDEPKDEQPAGEKRADCCGAVNPLEEQMSRNYQVEDRAVTENVYCLHKEAAEEPSDICRALQTCNDTKVSQELPVQNQNVQHSPDGSEEPSEPITNLFKVKNKTTCESPHSQIVYKSPASVNCPFITPLLPSATPASCPALPSLGVTPNPDALSCSPLTSSIPVPSLCLPLPYSPSVQVLSPPSLSPRPSMSTFPSSLLPLSPCRQTRDSSEPPAESVECPSNTLLHISGQELLMTERTAKECVMRHTHTLKAAAGGALVDACCLPGTSGGLYVAAAGKWAVCLWSCTSASDWSLKHTWSFSESVINVFPVPDAAGLVCVTLGQLEIREVRLLSCSSLTQTLVCEGVLQVVVGAYESRVVTSCHSGAGSTLEVFRLSDSSSLSSCQPLVSPGVCVGALAPVDGLSDALIGTDEGGHLFIWNLNTGQLLSRVLLGHGLSHTACLRGYSHSGVVLVLLQHQFLSSLDEEGKEGEIKDRMRSEEETKTALFSLVGVNPMSGKSILASRLFPPESWPGRLCEADVHLSSVVGLSQSGCVCMWDLGKRGATSRTAEAPEGEEWQLARWGAGGDMLVIGHHNGDVSLHLTAVSQE